MGEIKINWNKLYGNSIWADKYGRGDVKYVCAGRSPHNLVCGWLRHCRGRYLTTLNWIEKFNISEFLSVTLFNNFA